MKTETLKSEDKNGQRGKKRYEKLDGVRGFALLNMIAYHTVWDLVYISGFDWGWYRSKGAYIWQQGICWTFIFLSGFCLPLGTHAVRRGLTVSAGGAAITLATLLAVPDNRVVFGVLTLIGSCMLLVGVLDRQLAKLPPLAGGMISFLIFLITREVNSGYLGFGQFRVMALPAGWYRGILAAYFGFPWEGFYSSDYFSLIPWMFLFLAGYFTCRRLRGTGIMELLRGCMSAPVEWIGRHSFGIYMLHQPVIWLCLELIL